ncbi:hypothetical protein PUN28_005665 [Cardiocondyla obscurior]|uniref:Uncharacterized protein n=1 Tax=Cardiocondyla obscurior TaxID=286306 RepID=A0AAW2G5G5_9HYME
MHTLYKYFYATAALAFSSIDDLSHRLLPSAIRSPHLLSKPSSLFIIFFFLLCKWLRLTLQCTKKYMSNNLKLINSRLDYLKKNIYIN